MKKIDFVFGFSASKKYRIYIFVFLQAVIKDLLRFNRFSSNYDVWRHQSLNPSWKAKYPFPGISVYIKNAYFLMLFPTHSFISSSFEVEFSLTGHLAPGTCRETGSRTKKTWVKNMFLRVHMARINQKTRGSDVWPLVGKNSLSI